MKGGNEKREKGREEMPSLSLIIWLTLPASSLGPGNKGRGEDKKEGEGIVQIKQRGTAIRHMHDRPSCTGMDREKRFFFLVIFLRLQNVLQSWLLVMASL